jgi:hypothetical protein
MKPLLTLAQAQAANVCRFCGRGGPILLAYIRETGPESAHYACYEAYLAELAAETAAQEGDQSPAPGS